MIHESIKQNIIRIKRQSNRALRVALGQENAKMPIHVISTYAPRSGHNVETRQQHWQDVQELLNKTRKQHLLIWGEDANGQLGNRNKKTQNIQDKQHKYEVSLGPIPEQAKQKKEMEPTYTGYAASSR